MTDVWKSVGNYWCKYCKTFVRNDAFTKKKHEASERHQNSLKRFLKNLDKKKEREDKEKKAIQRELDRISGVTGLGTRSLDTTPVKKVAKIQPKKVKSVSHSTTAIQPIDIKSTVGILGAWEAVPVEKELKNEIENASVDISKSMDKLEEISVPERLREDYEDLRSFKIKEKTLPLETNEELSEIPESDLFKKRKFGTSKNFRKK